MRWIMRGLAIGMFALGMGLVALGCASFGGTCSKSMDAPTEQSRKLALELIDAISRGDADRILELYSDDVIVWTAGSLPFSGEHRRDELPELMGSILSLFPEGLKIQVLGVTAEGERVAIEAVSNASLADGRHYANHYHFLVIVRNGKVVELKEYMDTMYANNVLVEGE